MIFITCTPYVRRLPYNCLCIIIFRFIIIVFIIIIILSNTKIITLQCTVERSGHLYYYVNSTFLVPIFLIKLKMESSNRPKRQRISDREIDDSDADKDFHAPSESTDGSSSGKKHLCTILSIFYGLNF